ncbi:TPA: ead/Ea22-like family protein [Escherichia coli]|nr:ead/Ea22-like family protein [Escherichia coli]
MTIDYQVLREAAEKATQGEWVAFISSDTGTYAVHTPGDKRCEDVIKWTGFDGQKNAENNARYIAAFNPEVVQALLDERERNQQYIKRRDQENEDIALMVGKLRVDLEAAENNLIDSECHVAELEEALRDKQALLEASEKRIAELEAEPVSQTYKLNELSGNSPVTPDGWISCSERMPDDGQHVIILCDGAFVLYAQYRDGEFFDIVRNGDEFFETQSRNVTDWMPLPEPPKEVNRG